MKKIIKNIKFLTILKKDLKPQINKNEVLRDDFINVNWTFADNNRRSFNYIVIIHISLIFIITIVL